MYFHLVEITLIDAVQIHQRHIDQPSLQSIPAPEALRMSAENPKRQNSIMLDRELNHESAATTILKKGSGGHSLNV